MQKIHQSITINAPVAKVWDAMLGKGTYEEWTAMFNPGSRYEGDWSEGSKILFIGPSGDGTDGESGMVSRIAVNKPHEFISIEHLGIYANGVEDTTSEEAKKWSPAFENYTFSETDGVTTVTIDQDIEDEYKEEFEAMWKKALAKLKEICER
jgi:hypothetical protein